ncbi:MAG: phytanoyl-CoA dioxygenase family protein, partial [Chthoniobacteraceae bacterium]
MNELPVEVMERLAMERDLPARKRGGIEPCETGDAIFIINELPVVLPRLAALLIDPVLVGIVRRFLETDDIRYHFSNVTMKRGRIGSGISWHRDFSNRYICPKRSSFLRMMVCLDGMDAENGATQFVEGSHLISDEHAAGAVSSLAAADPQAVVMTACCGPGSLVLIHPKSVHGGAPNA